MILKIIDIYPVKRHPETKPDYVDSDEREVTLYFFPLWSGGHIQSRNLGARLPDS